MITFKNTQAQKDLDGGQSTPMEIPQDPTELARAKMAEYDLNPGKIVMDGELRRFDVGKRGDKTGWYVFHHGGDFCAGAFGDWRTDFNKKWCSNSGATSSLEDAKQKKIIDESIKQAAKELARNQAEAQKAANEIYTVAQFLEGDNHPYLKKKGVQAYYIKVCAGENSAFPTMKRGDLLIPLRDKNGFIWSLEAIKPNGKKRFQRHGKKRGNWFEIQGTPGTKDLYIGEGYSTCATIHELTGATVIVAFDAGNMAAIARDIEDIYRDKKIKIAADNDAWTLVRGNPVNTGILKAQEAGALINAPVVYPVFKPESIETWRSHTGNNEKGPTDFNDLAALEGGQAVRDQLAVNWDDQPKGFFEQNSMNVFEYLDTETEKDRIICSFTNGRGGIPYGELGIFAGEGATGKTQLLRQIIGSVAFGHDLTDGGLKINEIGRVLMVNGEDDEFSAKKFAKMLGIYFDRKGVKIPKKYRNNLHFFTRRRDKGLQPPRLVKQGKDGCVEPTSAFTDLVKKVQEFPPLALVLDSYSITIGIGENSNEIAGSAIGLIGTLQKYCGTILIITHTSQAASTEKLGKSNLMDALELALSEAAIRGVTAIKDNVRWACLATRVPQKFNPLDFGIKETSQVIAVAVPKTNLTAAQVTPVYFVHDVYRWKNKDGSWNSGMLLKYHDPAEFTAVKSVLIKDAQEKGALKNIQEAAAIQPVKKTLFTRGTNDEWKTQYGQILRPQNKDNRESIVSDLVKAGKLIEVKKDKTVFLELVENDGVENEK